MCSQIYASKTDVAAFLAKLKINPCPHCKKTGFLIKHGSLMGFVPNKLGNTVRAARAVRVFCSNRHLASGCGRTFSIWTADKIKHLFLCIVRATANRVQLACTAYFGSSRESLSRAYALSHCGIRRNVANILPLTPDVLHRISRR